CAQALKPLDHLSGDALSQFRRRDLIAKNADVRGRKLPGQVDVGPAGLEMTLQLVGVIKADRAAQAADGKPLLRQLLLGTGQVFRLERAGPDDFDFFSQAPQFDPLVTHAARLLQNRLPAPLRTSQGAKCETKRHTFHLRRLPRALFAASFFLLTLILPRGWAALRLLGPGAKTRRSFPGLRRLR